MSDINRVGLTGTIAAPYAVFDHAHPPPSPQADWDYQRLRLEFLEAQRTLQPATRDQGQRHARQ